MPRDGKTRIIKNIIFRYFFYIKLKSGVGFELYVLNYLIKGARFVILSSIVFCRNYRPATIVLHMVYSFIKFQFKLIRFWYVFKCFFYDTLHVLYALCALCVIISCLIVSSWSAGVDPADENLIFQEAKHYLCICSLSVRSSVEFLVFLDPCFATLLSSTALGVHPLHRQKIIGFYQRCKTDLKSKEKTRQNIAQIFWLPACFFLNFQVYICIYTYTNIYITICIYSRLTLGSKLSVILSSQQMKC